MVRPVAVSAFDPPPVHRIADPRPVDLARRPGAPAPPPAAGPPPSGPLVSSAPLLQIDPAWLGGGSASAFAQAKAAGAYGLASMPEVATLTPVAPKFAYEEISGLGYFPGDTSRDHASMQAYLREKISAGRDAAREEQRMSDAEGVEVRLAYDPNSESAVALYPGDEGYDEIRGARASFATMRWDLGRLGEKLADYADLLKL